MQRTMKALRKVRLTFLGWTLAGLPASAAAKPPSWLQHAEHGFYCNPKALGEAERARHGELTGRIAERRLKVVERENGYELQFRAKEVTMAELAEWATLESRCCPFLDFHIDLENEGRLACLRLTGRDGIKAFLRAEFHLKTEPGTN